MITFIIGVIVGVFLTMLAVAAWVVFEDEGGPDGRSDNHRDNQRDRPGSRGGADHTGQDPVFEKEGAEE